MLTEVAPGAHASKAIRYYRPELDVLRCLAFFLVFLHHALPTAVVNGPFRLEAALQEAGAGGVCVFFLLSAFLITELLLREREKTGTVHLRAFYLRRVLRIWPLYLLVLSLALLAPWFTAYASITHFLAPFLLFCGNWAIVLHKSWPNNQLFVPLWSISVEEQFYLVWPALTLLAGRRGVFWVSLGLLPCAWMVNLLAPSSGLPKDPSLWCNAVSQFQFFALGALLALLMHKRPVSLRLPLRAAMAGAATGLLLVAAHPLHFINPRIVSSPVQMLGGYLCLDLASVLLLCAFLEAPPHPVFRPLIYLGKISYGLYLFHYFFLDQFSRLFREHSAFSPAVQRGFTMLLAAAATILAASASYRYFEKRFILLKERFAWVPSRPA